ncbi:DUF3885 domain-containing protein [Loktanella sp. Alg231-35]|uniref:DUF3885 domain-containing protein n=1 Tax=Loktanella sp. Alg231-35 TaxID=1922220 RepID=UPI00131EFCB1
MSSELFEKSKSIWMLSASYGGEPPKKKRLKPFELCEIEGASFKYLGAIPQQDEDHIEAFGSDVFRHWDAVELDCHRKIREILWLALGAELGIKPRVNAGIYIVDFDRSIALHPYDDRGMDVVAMDKKHLSDLYQLHGSWLLDHDMSSLRAVFESG